MLEMDRHKVCYVIVKARAFDVQEDVVEEDYVSNPTDEGFRAGLAAYTDDPVFQELKAWIESLNIDEQCQLVALAWLGRGDYTRDEWAEAVKIASERHNERTAEYLLGMPVLADYLEEGLAAFDMSCEDFEMGHL